MFKLNAARTCRSELHALWEDNEVDLYLKAYLHFLLIVSYTVLVPV